MLVRLADWFISSESKQDSSLALQQKRLAVLYVIVTTIWAPIFAVLLYIVLDAPMLGHIALAGLLSGVVILFTLRFARSFLAAGNLLVSILFVSLVISSAQTTGITAPAQMWFIVVPMAAVLLAGRTSGLIWTLLVLAEVFVMFAVSRSGIRWESALSPEDQEVTRITSLIALPLLTLSLCVCYDLIRTSAIREIQSEQDVMKQFLNAQEVERQLLAYDLHDGLVQQLAGAAMYSDTALQTLAVDSADETEANILRATELVRTSIDEVRRLMRGLRPPALDEQGLVAAIHYLVDEKKKETDASIEMQVNGDLGGRLHSLVESSLFRACQESLNNALKYSRASQIKVLLDRAGQHVVLRVIDDGVGFTPSDTRDDAFGLRGIRQRARLLGGIAKIESQVGHGTQVEVQVPLVWASEFAATRPDSAPE